MFTVLLVVHVLVSIAMVGLILIQHGKGADMGAAFGSGASGTVFGSRGSASFLSKTTALLATAFFILTLALAMLTGRPDAPSSVVDMLDEQAEESLPAAPEAPADDDSLAPAPPGGE
ncbi:preprotein translocase subunit SecG [Alkalilimnicola sp. S0819]|nr:preprotein translocase subunit SecG [Alkalilimnicola sp. S0819]MPQ15328.1 preprotein translocase subunit SecG [Alkalilimnicola sp. S0819]